MSAQAIVIEARGPHIACHDLSGLSRQRCIHNNRAVLHVRCIYLRLRMLLWMSVKHSVVGPISAEMHWQYVSLFNSRHGNTSMLAKLQASNFFFKRYHEILLNKPVLNYPILAKY